MSVPFGFMGSGSGDGRIRTPGNNGGLGGSGSGGNGAGGGSGVSIFGYCMPGYGDLPTTSCTKCGCPTYVPVYAGRCISSDTFVMRENGSEVELGMLGVGEKILGIDCDGKNCMQEIVAFRVFEAECLEVSFADRKILCTHSHAFITPGIDELYANQAKPGDSVLGEDGTVREIVSIEPAGTMNVVALSVTPNHMFYAGGLVHHNKICLEEEFSPTP